MLLLIFAVDQHVIQADDHALVQEGSEDIIHGRWSIGQAKGHDCELIVAIAGPEGCLGNVLLLDADLMIAERRSILENTALPWTLSSSSSMRGRGYLFLMVILFKAQKSILVENTLDSVITRSSPGALSQL